jgi:hypothetical protein
VALPNSIGTIDIAIRESLQEQIRMQRFSTGSRLFLCKIKLLYTPHDVSPNGRRVNNNNNNNNIVVLCK